MICDNCMNNPKNNPYASGFCNCALPAMERGGWFQGGRTQTEKTFVTSNFTINYGSSKGGRTMTKLKPCPFCGGMVELSQAGEALDTFWYYIHHGIDYKCGIFMESELCHKDFPDEARAMKRNLIEAWNRRVKE